MKIPYQFRSSVFWNIRVDPPTVHTLMKHLIPTGKVSLIIWAEEISSNRAPWKVCTK